MIKKTTPSTFAFLAFLLLCTLTPTLIIPFTRATASLLPLAAVVVLMIYPLQWNRPVIRPSKNFWILLLSLGWLCITSTWALDAGFVLERTAKLAMLGISGLLMYGAAKSLSQQAKRALSTKLFWAFILGLLMLIVEITFNHPIYQSVRGYIPANRFGPQILNRPALMVSLLIWPALTAALIKYKNKALYALPLVLLILINHTWSQSALLALAVGIITFALAHFYPKFFLRAAFLTTGLGLTTAPWIAQYLFHNAPDFLRNWQEAAAAHRLEIWDFAARHALDKPFFGWGLEAGRFMPNFGEVSHFNDPNLMMALHPHNAALQIWLDLGLAGVIATLVGLYFLYRKFTRLPTMLLPGILATFTGVVSMSVTGYGMWQSWLVAFVISLALLWKIVKDAAGSAQ